LKGQFITQGPLRAYLREQVDFVPEHVWVDANGVVDVKGRTGDRVSVAWPGAAGVAPKEVDCSYLGLAAGKEVARSSPRRVDGYIRGFDLFASPDGQIVLRDDSSSLPPLLQTTQAVTVLERDRNWVHVREALTIYHHLSGWVRSDVFVEQPTNGMWGGYNVFVESTHRTVEVTELYEPKGRVPLGIEIASGVPVAPLGPAAGEFVEVALPGIMAKDPPSFFIPRSAVTEN